MCFGNRRPIKMQPIRWAIILVSLAIFAYASTCVTNAPRNNAFFSEKPLDIHLIGMKWAWNFQHSGGQTEINELHVPVDRAVKVIATSSDVGHTMHVPSLQTFMIALPGRYRTVQFTPTATGEYPLFCVEWCGMNHINMTGKVIVMEPNEYESWLHDRLPIGPHHPLMLESHSVPLAIFRSTNLPLENVNR